MDEDQLKDPFSLADVSPEEAETRTPKRRQKQTRSNSRRGVAGAARPHSRKRPSPGARQTVSTAGRKAGRKSKTVDPERRRLFWVSLVAFIVFSMVYLQPRLGGFVESVSKFGEDVEFAKENGSQVWDMYQQVESGSMSPSPSVDGESDSEVSPSFGAVSGRADDDSDTITP